MSLDQKNKIKVLVHSNYSRLVTGFGKNMKNILLALYKNEDFEVIEAANGVEYSRDMMTPWRSFGTYPDANLLQKIKDDPAKKRAAQYGYYTIDKIVEEVKPDIYLGIEDIWAFTQFENKSWWPKVKTVIWTTLDSEPILDQAYHVHKTCDQMLVWAKFAERSMQKKGAAVKTLHGAIDHSNFFSLGKDIKNLLRRKHNLEDSFVIGYVFKNQLRKSVPNILEGFKRFQNQFPESNTKLLLHTDWSEKTSGWDIEEYIKEKKIDPEDILSTYLCHQCGEYKIQPYVGEDLDCLACGSKKTLKTKTSARGVSESQLNEIYNLMDVYCHPFTSGGQELPVQEAKAAGLITLVTSYSCGLDSCFPDQGGIPLKWNEYREPHTNFIKASTCPDSICEELSNVFQMSDIKKNKLTHNGLRLLEKEFNVDVIAKRLKDVLLDVFNAPKKINVDAKSKNTLKPIDFSEMLDKEAKNRILFVMPESAGDVFMATALLPSMKKNYPDKDIYFATKKEFFPILLGNPHIYKILEYHPSMENLPLMEGAKNHKGYFEICFLPHIGTQRHLDYLHQGDADKITFDIHSKKYNNLCT